MRSKKIKFGKPLKVLSISYNNIFDVAVKQTFKIISVFGKQIVRIITCFWKTNSYKYK